MNTEKIVRDCLDGKEGAWSMLVNAFAPRIFSLCYQFAGTREEAEDSTQDIFLKLYHSLSKYDASRNFTAWFLTLARNHLIDQYRRTKWERKTRDDFDEYTVQAAHSENPEAALMRKQARKLVWEGFNGLSPDTRMAVILRDIQGKKYEEIAEILDLPLGTVKSRVNRGRLQLAKILNDRREFADAV